jgi:hypothetical protein
MNIYIIYIIINKLTRGQLRGQQGDKQGQMVKCPLGSENAKGTKVEMSPVVPKCPHVCPLLIILGFNTLILFKGTKG